MSIIKKILAFTFVLAMLSAPALASVDISGLSFDELVSLVNEAQFAMMKTDQWQKVTVPAGVYEVGKDIPAGEWTISAPPKVYVFVTVWDSNDESKRSIRAYWLYGKESVLYEEGNAFEMRQDLEDGMFLEIELGSVIFTPYHGNSFSFK